MTALDLWDYTLPDELIARYPAERRDGSRLMICDSGKPGPVHAQFSQILDWLRPHDLLVANNTRVMAARLFGRRQTGGRVEFLVLHRTEREATVLARPAKKLRIDEVIQLDEGGSVTLIAKNEAPGECRVTFDEDVDVVMQRQGSMPLPPYLGRASQESDKERYQTVYSGPLGAAAAPTAGLHFTTALLKALKAQHVGFATVTLHVGIGTFRPLTDSDIVRGTLHSEAYEVPQETAYAIQQAKAHGGRIIAVGTTSCRTLEAAAAKQTGIPNVGESRTNIFIQPPYDFKCVDGLITNFHLPRSSLLMLVGSLMGRKSLLSAYELAVQERYRFYSYGDAMLIL